MFSYEPFKILLIKKGIKISSLLNIISSVTIAKINKGEPISLQSLDKLCNHFDCEIEDIIKHIRDNTK